jgi:transcriptional regulator with XRE-family HTH domain
MKLKALIYDKGLNQWEIARRLGWTESRLSRYITGRQFPSDEDLLRLSAVLKISEDELRQILRSPRFDEVGA